MSWKNKSASPKSRRMSTATLSTRMDEPNKWYTAEDLKDFHTEEKYHNIRIEQTICRMLLFESHQHPASKQNTLDDLVFEGPSHWSRLKMRGCLLLCLV
jgi:hypothetical protein